MWEQFDVVVVVGFEQEVYGVQIFLWMCWLNRFLGFSSSIVSSIRQGVMFFYFFGRQNFVMFLIILMSMFLIMVFGMELKFLSMVVGNVFRLSMSLILEWMKVIGVSSILVQVVIVVLMVQMIDIMCLMGMFMQQVVSMFLELVCIVVFSVVLLKNSQSSVYRIIVVVIIDSLLQVSISELMCKMF